MSSFFPTPGTFETTAAYSLGVALIGFGLLLWYLPMAALYGIAAVMIGRFAQKRIISFHLRGWKVAAIGLKLGWVLLAVALAGGALSLVF